MKEKVISILIGLILALFFGACLFAKLYFKEAREVRRVQQNQNVLLSQEQERFQLVLNERDSLHGLSVQQLVLDKKELRDNRDSLVTIVDKLGIKLRRLESVTTVDAGVDVRFNTGLTDSIYVYQLDTMYVDTMKCINYKDAFNSFTGCIRQDSLIGARMTSFVPITQIAHRIPKKFLFFKYGTKAIKQEIFSENPSVFIKYAEVIELNK